jgi:hypothetical protein
MTVVFLWAKLCTDMMRFLVNRLHHPYLLAALMIILLMDANCIIPSERRAQVTTPQQILSPLPRLLCSTCDGPWLSITEITWRTTRTTRIVNSPHKFLPPQLRILISKKHADIYASSALLFLSRYRITYYFCCYRTGEREGSCLGPLVVV